MNADLPDHELTDFSVFDKQPNDDEDKACTKGDYASCSALTRLAYGLRYYSVLNILYNSSHLAIFENFIGELYSTTPFLNDYNHLMQEHEKDVGQIALYLIDELKLFKRCDIKQCQFTTRHQAADNHEDYVEPDPEEEDNNKPEQQRNELDAVTAFYKQTFDTLHFYLFHLFDAGLRVNDDDMYKPESTEQDKTMNDEYFDGAFARINKFISERKHITNAFGRFQANHEQNKFGIHGENNQTNKAGETYMDSLYKRLRATLKFSTALIDKFRAFIEAENYDSEAFMADMSDRNTGGNIAETMQKEDESFARYLESIVRTETAKTFSIGYRFYYWEWFKHREELELHREERENHMNHNGYTVADMYVERKYSSFKAELFQYGHEFNVKIYNEKVLIKAKAFIRSKKAKGMEARWDTNEPSLYHYGVRKFEQLRFSHLVAVILYTDYSKLSAEFTSTFRKKTAFELLSDTKKRNSGYWWWAKALRETVELYGTLWPSNRGNLRGPFYCGMSVRLNMPEFLIRLNGPTSTSLYQEVARNFCKEEGIIIQLNNNTGTPHYQVRGLNCSCFSRYPEEAERIFMGGYWGIQIEAVLVMQTNHNLQTVMCTLYVLDKMLNGQRQYDQQRELDARMNVNLLSNLFSFYLATDSKVQFDEYVAATFVHYVESKTHIHLRLGDLSERTQYVGMKDLIMHEIQKKDMKDVQLDLSVCALDGQYTNLFKETLFAIFRNATHLTIHAGGFPFSFLSLLRLIENTLLTKIVIEAFGVTKGWTGGISKGWLNMIFEDGGKYLAEKEKILQTYKDANYHIHIEENVRRGGGDLCRYTHCVITKQ